MAGSTLQFYLGGELASYLVRIDSVRISDVLNDAPNSAALTVNQLLHQPQTGAFDAGAFDAGAFSFSPVPLRIPTIQAGLPIQIYDGSTLLFGGEVVTVQQFYDLRPIAQNIGYHLSCTDYTRRLNRRKVLKDYGQQSVTAIVLDLLATFTQGVTTTHVAANLPILEGGISFTFEDVSRALSRLAERIGGYWYVDYEADLHFFLEETTDQPAPLIPAANFSDLQIETDLTQVRTRVLVEGAGSTVPTLINPGETILPIVDALPFQDAGGLAVTGQQRIRYTSRSLGQGGTVVGEGAFPSTAPAAAPQLGGGVPSGVHSYAVTFVSASGESLPSPWIDITVGGAITPPAGMQATPEEGSGLANGTYQYAVTFVTPSGETTPGPLIQAQVLSGVTAPAQAPTAQATGGGDLDPLANYRYCYTYSTAPNAANRHLSETTPSPPSTSVQTTTGKGMYITNIGQSSNPAVVRIILYRTEGNGSVFYEVLYMAAGPTQIGDNYADSYIVQFPTAPTTNTTGALIGQVRLTAIPKGPAGTTARNVYRTTANGSALKLLTTINDNTATTFVDNRADDTLGAAPPVTNPVSANQVLLSQLELGKTGVTARKLYRTVAYGSVFKLLATINDNTTTTYLDAIADASLGANAPTVDTSGLTQGAGQVNAGSASVPVAGTGAFAPTGGWAIIGNGEQVIRYTGVSGKAVTGIPASGPGAIVATISYGANITASPALLGIPASGAESIVQTIPEDQDIHLLTQSDDLDRQAALGALEGGDGVIEHYIQDRRLTEASARARGEADLALFKQIETRLSYTTRDPLTRSGKTIHVDLPPPTNLQGDFLIQTVTIADPAGANTGPRREVQASSTRFTFEDLLRRLLMEET